jgi:hypothetical protein
MDDERIEQLLAADERPVDAAAGLRRFRDTVAGGRVRAHRSTARMRWTQALAGALAAAFLFTGLALTGVADSFFTIFQPKQVATVTVGTTDLSGLPDLSGYGTLTITTHPAYRQAATVDQARADTGIAALSPGALPSGIPGDARFYTISRGEATFRFDQAKLDESAARASRTAPPMPAAIAASTLNVSGGPAVVQSYGGSFDPNSRAGSTQLPALLIAQSKAPVVRSDGATVEELRAYLLAQPGIPPDLAAQVRAIGDPSQTLLVPVPLDLASGKTVTVRGARGVFVGDSTGIGSAVVWVADGIVHVVAGSLGESELLAVADSLR